MYYYSNKIGRFCSALLLYAMSCVAVAQTATYIDLHGRVAIDSNPNYRQVIDIFKRLKRFSGRDVAEAELIILSSGGMPWAASLADGNIVLSDRAVELVYSSMPTDTANAWMAFVLGHELAHLKNNDHWHHNLRVKALRSTNHAFSDGYSYIGSQEPRLIKERELKADNDGFILASLAGYNTGLIFDTRVVKKELLQFWSDQTGAHRDESHYSPKYRTDFLRSRLQDLNNQVQLFHYGVKLAHFGRYEDALVLLKEFRRHYRSPAVLNNVAYVYLQLARRKMPRSLAYRFWFPTLIESDAGLPPPSRNYFEVVPQAAINDLEKAVLLLKDAIRQTDADLAVHLNLIVSYWHLGELVDAHAALKKAQAKWPKDEQLEALRAIVLLEQSSGIDADTWTQARNILKSLVSHKHAAPNITFNLARLLTERGRMGDAKQYWDKLKLESAGSIYVSVACEEYRLSCRSNKSASQTALYSPPIELGKDIEDPDIQAKLAGWFRSSGQLESTQVDIFTHAEGDSLLALDDVVELYTLNTHIPKEGLLDIAGPPDSVPLSKNIWLYNDSWAAIIEENHFVNEILFAR